MKLGGSVITDKSRYCTPRLDDLKRLAREVAGAKGPFVIVHGAGSFGHVLAKEHDLARGDDGDPKRRAAFARLLHDVRKLDLLVLEALLDAGLSPVPLSTFDLGRTLSGKLLHYPSHTLKKYLELGLTPVLSGDGVWDPARKFSILSGDWLMLSLARELRPVRAVFATDVDGVHDRDPREPGARLLAEVVATAPPPAGAAATPDVTGGMGAKLARAVDIARLAIPVHVVNGARAGALHDTLLGKAGIGTVIRT